MSDFVFRVSHFKFRVLGVRSEFSGFGFRANRALARSAQRIKGVLQILERFVAQPHFDQVVRVHQLVHLFFEDLGLGVWGLGFGIWGLGFVV